MYTLKEYQPYYEEFDKELFKFIGPSIYERENQSLTFRKTDRPVIYISLGTIIKGAKSFFKIVLKHFVMKMLMLLFRLETSLILTN